MATDAPTVTVDVFGGPGPIIVPWTSGMNAQTALELAASEAGSSGFSFALEYYPSQRGYLVLMINETFDTFASSSDPFFFWDFLINGTPSQTGIDNTILKPGDVVGFRFDLFDPDKHQGTLLGAKHEARLTR